MAHKKAASKQRSAVDATTASADNPASETPQKGATTRKKVSRKRTATKKAARTRVSAKKAATKSRASTPPVDVEPRQTPAIVTEPKPQIDERSCVDGQAAVNTSQAAAIEKPASAAQASEAEPARPAKGPASGAPNKSDTQHQQGNRDDSDRADTTAGSQMMDYWLTGARQAMEISRQSTEIGLDWLRKSSQSAAQPIDPLNISELFARAGGRISLDPMALLRANQRLLAQQGKLWSYAAERTQGNSPAPVIETNSGDRRFASEAWREDPMFDLLKQNYLLLSEWMMDVIRSDDTQDAKQKARLEFFTRQLIDAMAPTNLAATNPDVLASTIATSGQNLSAGMKNLQRDLENGNLNIRQVDPDAFKVGRDIATTPGSIVYENDLMQLIQFSPATDDVVPEPLLIIPPWINKYYILDLKPENSFIRWATEQGLTVFVVSWRNIDSSMRETTFDDYMFKGILDALSAIEQATDQQSVHAIGYCIGGTLLACTLAWMAARDDNRIRSATFFTAQVDFSEPGDLGLFIDEQQIAAIEGMMAERGYMDGADMARTFNMLRSNDLIWSFWVNNYLLGRDSLSFDLLFWNADSTRIPAPAHSFYLRQMYLHNNLVKPGAITLGGEALDLTRINVPVYLQATREDHIAPWRSVFKAKHNFASDMRFVLAGSGHIAGVVNPPQKQKYSYWTNSDEPMDAEQWLQGASETRGSWWPNWIDWITQRSGDPVAARVPGDGRLPAIEAAPGRYVLE